MKGSIQKRKGPQGTTYMARVEYPPDPATGKRRQRAKTFPTRKQAEAELAKWLTEIDRGTALVPSTTTVGDLLDQWLKIEAPKTANPMSLENYESTIRVHLKPALGHVLVQKLTVEHVESLYAAKREAGKSSSLIKKCHLRLSSALDMGVRWGLVNRNVCGSVKPDKLTYKKPDVWTRSDLEAFLAVAERDGMHPYWTLAIETGARTSELLGLTWDAVDWERSTITVGLQVVRLLKGTPTIKRDAKTEAGRRQVRLTSGMMADLKEHHTRWKERQLAASAWDSSYNLIFCTGTGRPINPRHVGRSFSRLVAQSEVKRLSPHGMRHTNITTLLAANGNMRAVADRVGHRDPTTTLKVYAHVIPQMQEELLGIVDAALPRTRRAS